MHSERHPLDPVSLIAGAIFVAVAVLGLTDLLTDVDPRVLSWLLPAALVLAGLAVLAQGLAGRRGAREAADEGAEPDR